MKRAVLLMIVTVLSLAQRSRDDYRAAYRAWRQTDPTLEHEAAAGGAPIAQRADRMAAEAAKSAAARKDYFDGLIHDEDQQVGWLESSTAIPDSAASLLDQGRPAIHRRGIRDSEPHDRNLVRRSRQRHPATAGGAVAGADRVGGFRPLDRAAKEGGRCGARLGGSD